MLLSLTEVHVALHVHMHEEVFSKCLLCYAQVHPSRKFLAVAEKGQNPNINVYEYPSLRLYRILRGGTERIYSFVDFRLLPWHLLYI
jgi:hypothetical protein